ncbi:MAG: leucine-rich repeat protein [Firmicutes bacterium]|nr:leucine-rich repeat protein [Bacillota bacterium]
MRKFVKIAAALLFVSLFALAFTACNNPDNSDNPKPNPTTLTYNPGTLANATFQTPYAANADGATAGSDTVTYAVKQGSTLPAGLTLNSSTGQISGTVTANADTYTFTLIASALQSNQTAEHTFTLTVNKADVSVAQPVYSDAALTYGDPLPAIITTTVGGTITLNAGQTLQAGTHNYAWTFTPQDTLNFTWTNLTGTISLTVNKADQTIPNNVQLTAVLQDSVTQIALTDLGSAYEYSRNNSTWQDSPSFTNLLADTSYTFYARLKETSTHNASAPISDTIVTTPLDEEVFTYSGNSITGLTNLGTTLTNLVIPAQISSNNITSIANYAFRVNQTVQEVNIPNSVTSIGNMAFYGCTGLEAITIPNSVRSIGYYAFQDCTGLTNVIFESGSKLWSIGHFAFGDCTGITSIEIPNSVMEIGYGAFSGCTGLTNVIFESGSKLTSIGHYAFGDCTGLTSITIPNSVMEIGYGAFRGCTGITSIEIPNLVTSIGGLAFWNCTGLTSITIPNSVTEIGQGAFRGCTGLTNVIFESGSKLTEIGQNAFSGCAGLTTIVIPSTVTHIDMYAFSGCTSLTDIYIQGHISRPSEWSSAWNGSSAAVHWGQ